MDKVEPKHGSLSEAALKQQKSHWQMLKEQLLKPKQLSRREILRRQKLREQRITSKHRLLRDYLLKAGLQYNSQSVSTLLFRICIFVNSMIALYLLYYTTHTFQGSVVYAIAFAVIAWVAVFLFILFLLWFALYLVLDLLIYKRRIGLEEVLPDFLLLASANIRAGMPIDKALWYAVRPRFGVLAKEMEMVAKETMSGEDFETALQEFSQRYDSSTLKNTVNLLIESIGAGGEIGGLLSRISANIQNNQLMRKEMAAGISAYALFIAIAAMFVAPTLFALSSQLLTVIASISKNISMPAVAMPMFSLGVIKVGISHRDFLIFTVINLFVTSLFSAMLITVIRKGEIKAGLRYIPVFIAISLLVFFVTHKVFSTAFRGFV